MIRTLPSIFVLTLMCCTIGYGLIYFPETGLPSSCLNSTNGISTGCVSTYVTANKTPSGESGEAESLQSPTPSVLPPQSAESKDLFVPVESTNEVVADAEPLTDAAPDVATEVPAEDAVEEDVLQENKSSESEELTEDVKTESSTQTSESNVQTESNDDLSKPISFDSAEDSNSGNDDLPIPSDPLLPIDPNLSSHGQSTPSITVGDYDNPADETPTEQPAPKESEQPEQKEQTLPFFSEDESEETEIIEQASAAKQTTEDSWDAVFNELLPSNSDSVKDENQNLIEEKAEEDSTQTESKELNDTPLSNDVYSEPGAVAIPPSDSKPVEQNARTSGVKTSPNTDILPAGYFQPAQGEEPPVPVEVAPLKESSVFIPAENCAVSDNNPPTDAWGFNIPANGYITVRRLPNAVITTEPKYLETLSAYQPPL